MEDFPWLPIAMVFIAFLSWLRNRIKEADEIRRARKAAKAEQARARRTTAPAKQAYETPYRDEPRREVVQEVPKTFRELFDEINAQEEIVPPPVPVSRQASPRQAAYEPPPLPDAVETFDDEPWGESSFDAAITVPKAPAVKKSKPRVKKDKHPFVEILSDGNQLRNALILKEVLGPPKALKDKGRR